jgi:hypothetical protein
VGRMREIKFRVWCKNKNQWETDKMYLSQYGGLLHGASMLGVNKEIHIVSFFTGLLDKSGREIYEGDIIAGEDGIHWKIVYRQAAYFAYTESTLVDIDDQWTELNIFDLNYFEVIGNIYENPELLK